MKSHLNFSRVLLTVVFSSLVACAGVVDDKPATGEGGGTTDTTTTGTGTTNTTTVTSTDTMTGTTGTTTGTTNTTTTSTSGPCPLQRDVTISASAPILSVLTPGDLGGPLTASTTIVNYQTNQHLYVVMVTTGGPSSWTFTVQDSVQQLVQVRCHDGSNEKPEEISFAELQATFSEGFGKSCDGSKLYASHPNGQPPFSYVTCNLTDNQVTIKSVPPSAMEADYKNGYCEFDLESNCP